VSEPPSLLILTDRHACAAAGHVLRDVLSAALSAGARDVLFREKDLDRSARARLARDVLADVSSAGGTMRVASDVALAVELGGLPVHLAASDPAPHGGDLAWGRSCHDDTDVHRARDEGANYVTVSPVFASASKPGYGPVLGERGLDRLIASSGGTPVIALGGVTADNCARCMTLGARGVAAMSYVMSAADPAGATARLLGALGGQLPAGV